jgi:leucyl-tRNA synthetase
MHLLYSRFFIKAIRDMGLIKFDEPFTRLFNQGIIIAQRQKMSKSKGNVIIPDEYVFELGADTVRAYLMFIAPWEQGGEWNDSGISGISRWFNREWNLVLESYQVNTAAVAEDKRSGGSTQRDFNHTTHQTIKKVTNDLENFRLNTMIASMMEFTNYLAKVKEAGTVDQTWWQQAIETLLLLLAPTAPHLAEELWQRIGREYSIHNQPWPHWQEELIQAKEITLVVQINGKLRDRITVPATISENEARQWAMTSSKVQAHLGGKAVIKVVYVPGRLVNLVAR